MYTSDIALIALVILPAFIATTLTWLAMRHGAYELSAFNSRAVAR